MLSTQLPTVLSVAALLISLFALYFAVRLAKFVQAHVLPQYKKADMASLSAELTDLRDAYDALLKSHKRLRAKIGMRAVRDKRNGATDDVPDWRTDPDGYKREMRKKHLRR